MISVCILTKNAEKSLRATLESVRCFAEVVLLDNGSSDSTLEIAKTFPNVKIYHSPFLGFGPLRNLAASKASFDWIFALDSDEVVSEELAQELKTAALQPTTLYQVRRENFFQGKKIRGSGWGSDWVYRLYHRKKTQYQNQQVHESIDVRSMNCQRCSSPLLHTPYQRVEDFLSKMQIYTSLYAKEQQYKKKGSFSKAVFHGVFALFSSFFLKKGFLDGKIGWMIALYNGQCAFYKYLKLAELQRNSPFLFSPDTQCKDCFPQSKKPRYP